jgi:hypothetical protein
MCWLVKNLVIITSDLFLNLLNTIESLYNNKRIMIKMEHKVDTENPLGVNRGLWQGCELRALLFYLYTNREREEWKNMQPKVIILGDNRYFNSVLLADEQLVLANNKIDLQ